MASSRVIIESFSHQAAAQVNSFSISSFTTMREHQKVLADFPNAHAVLNFMDREMPKLEAMTVLRSLIQEFRTASSLAGNMLLCALAPLFKRELKDLNTQLPGADVGQEVMLALFEIITSIPLERLADKNLHFAIRRAFRAKLKKALADDRKEDVARKRYFKRVSPLGPHGMNCERGRLRRVRPFNQDEKVEAKKAFARLAGAKFQHTIEAEVWVATTIDGEHFKDVVRRQGVANDDSEAKRIAGKMRTAKSRFEDRLRLDLELTGVVANGGDHEQAAHGTEWAEQFVWGGSRRVGVPYDA